MGFINTLTPGCYGSGEQDEYDDDYEYEDKYESGFDDYKADSADEQDKLEE